MILSTSLTESKEVVRKSGIRNGLAHIFAPHATGILIVTEHGRVVLGTWQSLVFVETDVHPRQRIVIMQVIGE